MPTGDWAIPTKKRFVILTTEFLISFDQQEVLVHESLGTGFTPDKQVFNLATSDILADQKQNQMTINDTQNAKRVVFYLNTQEHMYEWVVALSQQKTRSCPRPE
jgi:hypothetical protein